eukprot:783171-Pelagomonas_calceolata.AAC.6
MDKKGGKTQQCRQFMMRMVPQALLANISPQKRHNKLTLSEDGNKACWCLLSTDIESVLTVY